MYEKGIVSFIDILGFKEIVDTSTPEEVNSILNEFHKFAKEDPDYDFAPKVISFSDSIVRVRKTESGLNYNHPLGLVYIELKDLLLAQVALIYQGIIVRGGIAYGDIYFSKSHIYGPALNRAYELEAYYAIYPRIVVSPGIINEVKHNHLLKDNYRSHEEELGVIQEFIKQGDDGLWFIDYLRKTEEIVEASDEVYPQYLLKHKKFICEHAQKYDEMSKDLGKYLWMAKYYNEFVVKNLTDQQLACYQISRRKLEISAKDLPVLQDMRIVDQLK